MSGSPNLPSRLALFTGLGLLALSFAVPALAAPAKLNQQGRLLDDGGDPLEGAHQLTFRLYDDSSDGQLLWSESRNLDLSDGYYATVLGDQTPIADDLFGGAIWLELSVDGEVLEPRHQVVSVPTAMRATVAQHVDGGVVDATEVWVGGSLVINDQGNWVGANGASSWDDLSDVPAGLADGEDADTLGDVTCFDGGVPSWSATASQWLCSVDGDTLGSMSCGNGQLAKWDSVAGQWVCASDTDSLGSLGCFDGGIPSWNSTLNLWVCAADQDTDSDSLGALTCGDGGIPTWSALLGQWTCTTSADTVLTQAQVETYIVNGPLDLDAATTFGGEAPALLSDLTTALDWSAINNVPADIADGDDILTETQVEGFITNAPVNLAAGTTINGDLIGAGANLGSNVTIGAVLPGNVYTSTDTPLTIPDQTDPPTLPPAGASSVRFVSGGSTINNFSVDVNITHPDIGDLKIVLHAPSQSSVVLYDGELAGTINMIGNIARDYAISGGTIYALYNEPSNGTWRLEVIDNTATASGTLNSWALNINEEWSGDLFVGNSITSDGDITTTGNIEVIQGSDLIFKNVAGTETFRIDGETGLITGASGSCPNGMTQMGDFCIEDNQRTSNAAWYTALERCDDPTRDGNDSGRPAGLRLCFMSEWQLACRKQRDGLAPSITGMNNSGQEWTGSIKSNYNEYAMWAQRCDNGEINSDGWGNSKQFRCCKNL